MDKPKLDWTETRYGGSRAMAGAFDLAVFYDSIAPRTTSAGYGYKASFCGGRFTLKKLYKTMDEAKVACEAATARALKRALQELEGEPT